MNTCECEEAQLPVMFLDQVEILSLSFWFKYIIAVKPFNILVYF